VTGQDLVNKADEHSTEKYGERQVSTRCNNWKKADRAIFPDVGK